MKNLTAVTALVAVISIGCSKPDASSTTDSAAAAPEGMANMPGMAATGAAAMAGELEAHLKALKGVSADSVKTVLSSHRQMTANLIGAFTKEMRDMNMPADAAWNATVDSLRADLRTMPELGATALQGMMPRHEARVMRLIRMHQTMMKNMK